MEARLCFIGHGLMEDRDPSPMHEARHRPIRRNPRYLHTVRRVAPPSGGHVV